MNERSELFESVTTNPKKELSDKQLAALEWLFDHAPNKHFNELKELIFGKHNERKAGRKAKNIDDSMFFVVTMRKARGDNYKDIAKDLGVDVKTLRKFMVRRAQEVAEAEIQSKSKQ